MKALTSRDRAAAAFVRLGVCVAAFVASAALASAQTPKYSKLADLPATNRSFPGDYQTPSLSESPSLPGTFFGQLGLDENNGAVYWVNSTGLVTQGTGIVGNCPQGYLTSAGDGTFWGTSGGMGGTGVIWYGAPTVPLYKVDAHGAYAPIYNFTFDQGESFNQVTLARGNIYGTANIGGVATSVNSGGDGTIFKVTPDMNVVLIRQLNRATTPSDAALPTGALLLATDGNLYGAAVQGGTKGDGVVFKIDAKDNFSIIHSFVGTDGQAPFGNLVQGRNGLLYGTTAGGGKYSDGVVFSMTTSGKVTVLHSFGDPTVARDGINPVAGLAIGSDGNLYGTTQVGGASSDGTVFQMTPEGKETIIHSFGATSSDGTSPCGGLTVGMDGNLYGTTSWGGAVNFGTVFKVVIQTPPVLTVSATASASSVLVGDNIVYTIQAENHGTVTAYDVQLTAAIPAHTQLAGLGSGSTSWTQSGTQLVTGVGSLEPGQKVTATLVLKINAGTTVGTKIVGSFNGLFTGGMFSRSTTATATIAAKLSGQLGFTVENNDPNVLVATGSGSASKAPASGKLQLTSKLHSLWLNFDVTNNASGASWIPSTGSSQGVASLQVIPPNGNVSEIVGTFTSPNDSLTVTASPFSGGLGHAALLNGLQILGLLPITGVDSTLQEIASVLPKFAGIQDFANASTAFNQALIDYTNSNWAAVGTDLQSVSTSLTALAGNATELSQFEMFVQYLYPAAKSTNIKTHIVNASQVNSLANLFTDGPNFASDILQWNLSAGRSGGALSSTFYGLH